MSRTKFSPMLASHAPADLSSLRYPLLASPKLDGIRCLVVSKDWYLDHVGWPDKPHDQYLVSSAHKAIAVSRTLKPIQNSHIQTHLDRAYLAGFDGELIVGPANAHNVYATTESGVMSREGEPDFAYHIFDRWDRKTTPYAVARAEWLDAVLPSYCTKVPHERVDSTGELESYEQHILQLGYEGAMIRDLGGPYKYGRATEKQGWLLKLKRFVDGEARIISMEEKLFNANELVYDERGYAKRSSRQDGKIPADTMGALVVEDLETRVQFSIGTGFDDNLRKQLWTGQQHYNGRIVKYKYFPVGIKERPRHPVYLGMRSEEDL